MEELKNKLGEGYAVSPVDVNKNNGTILHGISILLNGNIGGPMVYVDNFYANVEAMARDLQEILRIGAEQKRLWEVYGER